MVELNDASHVYANGFTVLAVGLDVGLEGVHFSTLAQPCRAA
ncbi:MAG TPA: hypothetical protein VGA98_10720 [Allosphingosinicella sp.]|jgi:hypothetical protein